MVRDALLIRPYVTSNTDDDVDQALGEEITPPHRLIARGLLVPIDADTVELPREVGIALRGGFVTPTAPAFEPEPLSTTGYDQDELNRRACTSVMELLRLVDKPGSTGRRIRRSAPADRRPRTAARPAISMSPADSRANRRSGDGSRFCWRRPHHQRYTCPPPNSTTG